MYLKNGDTIEIIAPSAKSATEDNNTLIIKIQKQLQSWGLNVIVAEDIFGDDLLCANTHEKRLTLLKAALNNPHSKAIWAFRGGYGCSALIPELLEMQKPLRKKLVMGFSDITALHIFVQQQWEWESLHSPSARQIALNEVNAVCIAALKDLLFTENACTLPLIAMNTTAEKSAPLTGKIIGGNGALVQASLGSNWQIQTKDKILFLEDINEPAYRIDRMLNQFSQAQLFNSITALLLGDFSVKDKGQQSKLDQVLQNWAKKLALPVFRLPNVGHTEMNFPLALGKTIHIATGKNPHIHYSAIT